MNWEETIIHIRLEPSFKNLIRDAYLDEDLMANVRRYRESAEFKEVLKRIRAFNRDARTILDIGSGNGITSISLALEGFQVTAVEPDESTTVGCGAINYLKDILNLDNIAVYRGYCEDINFETGTFDIAFARQCMHHAYDLKKFVSEMSRVLKTGGLFFTIRDHVIYDDQDKEWFLNEHPLHKFYMGENAFTANEYKDAIMSAGLNLLSELKHYESVINYFPKSTNEINNLHINRLKRIRNHINSKYKNSLIQILMYNLHIIKNNITREDTYSESKISGRMYSYLAVKK